MSVLVSIVVDTLVFGSLYALLAGGLSLVWSTLDVFNFAHGALMMFGAMATWYFVSNLGVSIAVGIPLVILSTIVLGWVIFYGAVRPFMRRQGSEWVIIVSTLVVATILEDGAEVLFGGQDRGVATVVGGGITIAGSPITGQEILVIVLGPGLLIAMAWFLKRTRLGLAIRGVSQNLQVAQLVGIRPERVYRIVFVLAAVLAAIAGLLYGGEFGAEPSMSESLLLTAFVVVVIGGLSSLRGTVLGAYLVAAITAIGNYYVGLFWAPALLYGALILVLILRPQGLATIGAGT